MLYAMYACAFTVLIGTNSGLYCKAGPGGQY